MDIFKIIKELNKISEYKQKESEICTRGRMTTKEMVALSKGYSMAISDLNNMIKEQKPPCTGSSIQKEDIYKFKKGNNVVTKDGKVRNLLYANKVGTEWYVMFNSGNNTKSEHIITDSLEKEFDRIGEYDFTKDKIEKLENKVKYETRKCKILSFDPQAIPSESIVYVYDDVKVIVGIDKPSNEDIVNKVNEIIDCLNKKESE